jgi:predicted DsbA family dithiol-disulfide isomerase
VVLIVYSDYACPFAYVGHRRVAKLRAQGRLEVVEWRPFELHPEIPVQGVPRPRGRGGAGTLRALLEEDGLPIKASPVAWNSRLALLAAEHARDLGAHEAVHERLFAAAWEEGEDLGRPEVLAHVLHGAGVDGDAIVEAARSWTLVDRITESLEDAWSRGITGTPSYVTGDGRILRGVQDPADLADG